VRERALTHRGAHATGRIAAAELYVAVLLLYHRINSFPLGGGLKKPPTRCVAAAVARAAMRFASSSPDASAPPAHRRQEVLAVMANHDKAGKGYLTHDEFVSASQDLFKCAALRIAAPTRCRCVRTPLMRASPPRAGT
jgi:hypothetical protein